MTNWTLDEAAQLLDPPITAEQLRHLVLAADIQPAGRRHTGRPGRPLPTYDAETLMRAHAAIAPLLAAAERG